MSRKREKRLKPNLSQEDQAKLDQFKAKERARRLCFASQIHSCDFGKATFSSFTYQLCIRRRELRTWIRNFESQGQAGLEPDWGELPGDEALRQAEECLIQLGEFANAEKITSDDVTELMRRNGWPQRKTERLLERYRTGGLFGLTPAYNPYKPHRKAKKSSASTIPDETALAQAVKVSESLGWLIEKERAKMIKTCDVQRRAKESGETERTLWNNLRKYREGGYAGLVRKKRSDKDLSRGLSDRMIEIIRGIRFQSPHLSISGVFEEAQEMAIALGETEPTEAQVRAICARIPEGDLLLAKGLEDAYRSRIRLTALMHHTKIIYQVDFTVIDVLAIDQRKPPYRTKSGAFRPRLLTVVEVLSGTIVAHFFTYLDPDQYDVAAVLRLAFIKFGVPDEVWFDRGKCMIAHHIQQLVEGLGAIFVPLPGGQPQQKGVAEKAYDTFKKQHWVINKGYTGSNVQERDPQVKPVDNITQIAEGFQNYLDTNYHQKPHGNRDLPPLQYWGERIFLPPVDPRELDTLMMEPETRTVKKTGVKYKNHFYFHSKLGEYVEKQVLVRSSIPYIAPDTLEVFDGETYLCTAVNVDTPEGEQLVMRELPGAQRQQRKKSRDRIKKGKEKVQEAQKEINQRQASSTPIALPKETDLEVHPPESKARKKPPKRSFLDRMAD